MFTIMKYFHSFINLGFHFDLCENETYSRFAAKTFLHLTPKKPRFFYKLKMLDKVLFSIYTLKQK